VRFEAEVYREWECRYCDIIYTGIDDDDEDYDDDEDEYGERLNVRDAALIWASRGKDEDYTFGYSEEELEDALG